MSYVVAQPGVTMTPYINTDSSRASLEAEKGRVPRRAEKDASTFNSSQRRVASRCRGFFAQGFQHLPNRALGLSFGRSLKLNCKWVVL